MMSPSFQTPDGNRSNSLPMPGIGINLRRQYRSESFGEMMGQYGTAAMISCGPWLISILTQLLIGVLGPPREA
jgi:uncharacterized membrane protein